MTYKQLITKLEKEVNNIQSFRDKCKIFESERIAYGRQSGLLYAIDQLKNKKDIK